MEIYMKKTFSISTKPDENSAPVATAVEIDFDGFTLDHAIDAFFGSTSPRVLLQSRLRKLDRIPSKYSVRALDLLGKVSPTAVRPMTPAELIAAVRGGQISPEEVAALKEMLGQK